MNSPWSRRAVCGPAQSRAAAIPIAATARTRIPVRSGVIGDNRGVNPPPLKIALGQTNPVTGDLDGNASRIAGMCADAAAAGAQLAVFPELALTGYGADDLFGRTDFLEAGEQVLAELAARISGLTVLVGYAEPLSAGDGGPPGEPAGPIAASTVAVLADGGIRGRYRKRLPGRAGGVDQPARFRPGNSGLELSVAGNRVGVLASGEYAVPALVPDAGLTAIADSAPYVRGGARAREQLLRDTAVHGSRWIALAAPAGGQDELLFEGAAMLVSPEGDVISRGGQFTEELLVCDPGGVPARWLDDIEELYAALVAGIRDYVLKNGFERVGLGLSGGIDSALVAALAADALGGERVTPVVMPSRYSGGETQSDAREMASRLGCELVELAIEDPLASYETLLGPEADGVAGENLQARIRGNLLMALSNSRGWLVLATSNKSEAAVGYATLYGDMTGGLAPIQDVPKSVVFELCRYRNGVSPVIPESIIERPPSAELSPDQKDSDALPEYPVLDRILDLYLEQGIGASGMISRGEDPATVAEVVALVDRSEYKRRQAPPGLRVSRSSFARDRRMPLTSGFAAGPSAPVSRRNPDPDDPGKTV